MAWDFHAHIEPSALHCQGVEFSDLQGSLPAGTPSAVAFSHKTPRKSGQRDSNPDILLGTLAFDHCTTKPFPIGWREEEGEMENPFSARNVDYNRALTKGGNTALPFVK